MIFCKKPHLHLRQVHTCPGRKGRGVSGRFLKKGLWLPEKLHQGINLGFAIDVLDPHHPRLPIHVAIGLRAREMNGIVLSLIWPFGCIGGPTDFELITVQGIGLVEDLNEFRHNHIVERSGLHGATARLRTPIHLEGSLEEELGMFWLVGDDRPIAEVGDIHAAGWADKRTQERTISLLDG